MAKRKALGFGYIPEESKHHFLVYIPQSRTSGVSVYEKFEWEDEPTLNEMSCKVSINRQKWDAIKDALKTEFNKRLREYNITSGQWKTGIMPVDRLLGKEMVLLMWAIEDCDPTVIPNAINNWLGLAKEERWWLFTMTNASTGHVDDKRGWRKAVRFALTENPVEDSTREKSIIEEMFINQVKAGEK